MNFSVLFRNLEMEDLVSLRVLDNQITIQFSNRFIYPLSQAILQKYDKHLKTLMQEVILQMELNDSLSQILPSNMEGKYCLVNPNRIYFVTNEEEIVTDGFVEKIDSVGNCIVEKASYVFVIKPMENIFYQVVVYYGFVDKNYLQTLLSAALAKYTKSDYENFSDSRFLK